MNNKNYKYDATIFLPIWVGNKQRIDLFDEIGIINCEKSKIKICFLTGTEIKSQEELIALFPNISKNENIDLTHVPCHRNHPASKVYDFYLRKDLYEDSKWIIRIDDDTSTDVDKTMNFLLLHDQEKEYLFLSNYTSGDISLTKEILEKHNLYEKIKFSDSAVGLEQNYTYTEGDSYNLEHEHEILIFSNYTISCVVEKYKDIILDRSMIQSGYTDQLFFNLCKIERIHGTKIKLLDSQGNLTDYLSGRSSHIHNISHEKTQKISVIRNFIKQKIKPQDSMLSEKTYLLTLKIERTGWNKGIDLKTSLIKFGKNGQIEGDNGNNNLKYWHYDKDNKKLKILTDNFKTCAEYQVDESNIEFIRQPKKEMEDNKQDFVTSFLILQN